MQMRKMLATTLIAGAMSAGAAGLAMGGGAASAQPSSLPNLSDLPCNPNYSFCPTRPRDFGPVLQGPGIWRPDGGIYPGQG